jgi:hypothetical protein
MVRCVLTQREAQALEQGVGCQLDWIEVTTHNDPERMLRLISPRCASCGTVAPHARCPNCGAGPRWPYDGRG